MMGTRWRSRRATNGAHGKCVVACLGMLVNAVIVAAHRDHKRKDAVMQSKVQTSSIDAQVAPQGIPSFCSPVDLSSYKTLSHIQTHISEADEALQEASQAKENAEAAAQRHEAEAKQNKLAADNIDEEVAALMDRIHQMQTEAERHRAEEETANQLAEQAKEQSQLATGTFEAVDECTRTLVEGEASLERAIEGSATKALYNDLMSGVTAIKHADCKSHLEILWPKLDCSRDYPVAWRNDCTQLVHQLNTLKECVGTTLASVKSRKLGNGEVREDEREEESRKKRKQERERAVQQCLKHVEKHVCEWANHLVVSCRGDKTCWIEHS